MGDPAEGSQDTRRVVARGELDPETWRLAQRLSNEDNRLVVIAAPSPGNDTGKLVHQALIRNWPTLVRWLDDERSFNTWHQQLKADATCWISNLRSERDLLHGSALAVAEDWIAQRGSEITPNEKEFISASTSARLRAQRRKLQLPLVTAAGIAVAFILVAGGFLVANRSGEIVIAAAQHVSEQNDLRRGYANLLGELATVKLAQGDLDAALRFAVKGVKDSLTLSSKPSGPNPSEEALAATLSRLSSRLVLTPQGVGLHTAVLSPDGLRIITTSDRTARIWDAKTGRLIETLEGHGAPVSAATFSPDGKQVVTASSDGTARIWDATDGKLVETLEGHGAPVSAATFSPDGKQIVTASSDGTARIWDATDGKLVETLKGHTPVSQRHSAQAVNLSQLGHWIGQCVFGTLRTDISSELSETLDRCQQSRSARTGRLSQPGHQMGPSAFGT